MGFGTKTQKSEGINRKLTESCEKEVVSGRVKINTRRATVDRKSCRKNPSSIPRERGDKVCRINGPEFSGYSWLPHTHPHPLTRPSTHIHTYIHAYIHTYIHAYIQTHQHAHPHTSTHTHTPTHAHTHTHTSTYIYIHLHYFSVAVS